MNSMLLIGDRLSLYRNDGKGNRKRQFTRLLEQCQSYESVKLPKDHPATSITFMGMAAANLSLAWLLTGQRHYLKEAKRWIFTACDYGCWGYGFLVDVDLSASWLLYGFGLSYSWIKDDLTKAERQTLLDKLKLQGQKMFDYGEANRGNCWSTDYWQNHNWINYTGLLTTAYGIVGEFNEAQTWIDVIKDNFSKVFDWMPEDGSNYEGTGYWRYAINFLLSAAQLLKDQEGVDYFSSPFMTNTFWFRLYQSAPNWEENVNFSDVHDRRSSHSLSAYYKIASVYDNGYAQWLADRVRSGFLFREAYESKIFPGILPEAFLEYLWYDPSVARKAPSDLPLTRFFPDLGLSVIRSSWEEDAIHFSIKSSAPGGHKQWQKSWELDKANGWRTRSLTHYHVDFNSFVLMGYNSDLAIDEGFHRTSRAKVHNMVTVDGTGCVGEKIWDQGGLEDPENFDLNCKGIYNVWRDVPEEAVAEVEVYDVKADGVYSVMESARMYYPEMKLRRNARHVLYSGLGYLVMVDELKSEIPHTYTWRLHGQRRAEKVSDGLFRIENGAGALDIHAVYPKTVRAKTEATVVREIMTPQRPTDIREIRLETLCLENEDKLKELDFLTVLHPKAVGETALEVTTVKVPEGIGIEIKCRDTREEIVFAKGRLSSTIYRNDQKARDDH